MTTQRIELGLTEETASTCGCGGCGCGADGAADEGAPASAGVSSDETTVEVAGMTCGHCVAAVTEEVGAIDGVEDVSIALNAGGLTPVTIRSRGPVDPADLRAAIEEAGYTLAPSA
ncbi:MAG: heavy-metal-associated domain-containing protein [Microbacterium sp.]